MKLSRLEERMRKNTINSGITLIALIVTIVILLILARNQHKHIISETIGILKRAIEAREDTIIGKEKEAISLAWNSLIINKHTNGTEITDEMFENELKNNGYDVTVNYNESGNFLVYFKDTGHSYVVDSDGNIILQSSNDVEDGDNTDVITSEEYIIQERILNEEYTIDGWGNDNSTGKPDWSKHYGSEERWGAYASWRDGKCGIYFEPTLNFDYISKIEADVVLTSNMNGLTNTVAFGVQKDAITQDGTFDISESVISKTSLETEYNIQVDTSDITGTGYLKLYLTHGPENSAYTVAVGIKNLKIYYDNSILFTDDKVNNKLTIQNNSNKEISSIKYLMNNSNTEEILSNGKILNMSNNKATLNYTTGGTYYFVITFADGTRIKRSAKVGISDFTYTGSAQEYTVPTTGYYQIQCWGASGGRDNWVGSYLNNYGTGGYASGIIKLTKGEKIYVYVGQQGADGVKTANVATSTSFNGGGSGMGSSDNDDGGGAGGGATDIRLVNGDWDNFESLKSRIMVAGGGSGGATVQSNFTRKAGGSGGGLVATGSIWKYSNSEVSNHTYNATQTTGYKFGIGQNGITKGNAGGAGAGGGYYGGYSSTDSPAGGAGGGSGFISGYSGCNAISEESTEENIIHTGQSIHYSNKYFTYGVLLDGNAENYPGNGYVIIKYLGTENN